MSKGDLIKDLPDLPSHMNNDVSEEDKNMINMLFNKNRSNLNVLASGLKDVIMVGLLFIILNISYVDDLIIKFIPSASTSKYVLVLLKSLAMMLLYFVINNWYLNKM